jgi:hypothetical protein
MESPFDPGVSRREFPELMPMVFAKLKMEAGDGVSRPSETIRVQMVNHGL